MISVTGWDIGGANTKATFLTYSKGQVGELISLNRYFPIWTAPASLTAVLQEMARSFPVHQAVALTMTAELSDAFPTKREGVRYILASAREAFQSLPLFVVTVDGSFLPVEEALEVPLAVAAANWAASATLVAKQYPWCLFVDTGSTTTDIIPIINGQIAARGKNDLERLLAGELVYTGALRTPVSAITREVPVRGKKCPLSSEYFAIAADVHLLLNNITEEEYSCPSPDGRDKTLQCASARLARVVCGDSELLTPLEILTIARELEKQQVAQIAEAISQVLSGITSERKLPLVITGTGKFLAMKCAQTLGLEVVDWNSTAPGPVTITSFASAYLLAEYLEVKSWPSE